MTKNNTFIQKHSAAIYFTLTFILTWGCMFLMLGPGGLPITPEQFEISGPLVYLGMLIGPSAAGILTTALVYGKTGLRNLFSRLINFRAGFQWYASAILFTPLLAAAVLLALSLISPEFFPPIFAADNFSSLLLSGYVMGIMVGLFEELGWTGFVVPQMRTRSGIFATGIIVGILWGAWHFIVFWEVDTFTGAFPLALLLARLFSWLPPFRMLMVWVYDRTKSLPIVILMHASLVATTNTIVPANLTGNALLTWIIVWALLIWGIAAAVATTNRRRISTRSIQGQVTQP